MGLHFIDGSCAWNNANNNWNWNGNNNSVSVSALPIVWFS